MIKSNPFKWRHHQSEIILLCVRWYLRYSLSSRDLEEMMNERGLSVDHTTIYRWVQAYAPELEKRIRPHLRLRKGQIAGIGRGEIQMQVKFVSNLFGIAA